MSKSAETAAPTVARLALSVDEAAAALGIDPATFRRHAASGALGLGVYKLGGRTIVNLREAQAWLDAGLPDRTRWAALWPAGGEATA